MDLFDLAEAFKTARIASGQTQADVAAATGIGVQTISKFERAALTEIGAIRLLALLKQVGLELYARPAGHRRTLDDIGRELNNAQVSDQPKTRRQRVRRVKINKPIHV